MWLSIIGFMGAILYTIISVSNASNATGKQDMVSAITTITIVNGALCLTMAGIGYFSINSAPILRRPYIFIILHMAIILSMIGVCVSSLKQLDIDPTYSEDLSSSKSNQLNTATGLGSIGFALGLVSIGLFAYSYNRTGSV